MSRNADYLKGKTAIVTGAAGGIGRAICHMLAGYGVNLLLVGRNREKLEVLRGELEAYGTKNLCLSGDLTRASFPEQVIRAAAEQFGGIDILINNAGVVQFCGMEEISGDMYDSVMDTNVRAPFFLCLHALKYLRKSGCATIVNICSASSHKGYPGQTLYVASKHALLGMTKSLAAEMYREHIRVHAVSPGAVSTDMLPVIKPDWNGDEQMLDPKDIAGIIAFLLEQRMTNAVIDEVMVNRSTKEPFVV